MTRLLWLVNHHTGVVDWGAGYDGQPVTTEAHYLGEGSPCDYSNYVTRRGLLVPRKALALTHAHLVATESETRWSVRSKSEKRIVGGLSALVEIRSGVPKIQRLDIEARHGLTQDLLSRVPVRELANRTAAQLSLTDRQEAQFVIEPGSDFLDWQEAGPGIAPMPVPRPPLPNLVDPRGRPWWLVTTYIPTARSIDRLKRTELTDDFYREVHRVYRQAIREGRKDTTQAVKEWNESRTGRRSGTSTVRKWVSEARRRHEEKGKHDAKDN